MTAKLLTLSTFTERAVFDGGAAEISDFDPVSQRLFVVNGAEDTIDIVDYSNPSQPTFISAIDISPFGAAPNSVAVKNGVVAVAVENNNKQDPGEVVFFDTNGTLINSVTVGALPDMLTFTPDGSKVLVANEGEPNDAYTVDPEGSVSIINLPENIEDLTQDDVTTADFKDFNSLKEQLIASGVRIFGPGATVAQDLEPEFIAVAGNTAYVTLQENNAVAVLDIAQGTITDILPLGVKLYEDLGIPFDASNEDGGINLQAWRVAGMYQPDSIATATLGGNNYFLTANRGGCSGLRWVQRRGTG